MVGLGEMSQGFLPGFDLCLAQSNVFTDVQSAKSSRVTPLGSRLLLHVKDTLINLWDVRQGRESAQQDGTVEGRGQEGPRRLYARKYKTPLA